VDVHVEDMVLFSEFYKTSFIALELEQVAQTSIVCESPEQEQDKKEILCGFSRQGE
jgi:endonuclease IV